MPRTVREKSTSGYYHILLRGIGRQNIFEDDEDKIRFIETIFRHKKELEFELHAYCLMGNHVHILIKDTQDNLQLMMKKITGSHAYYLTVLGYIHQNPKKSGISTTDEYEWSSYKEYFNKFTKLDIAFAIELLGGKEKLVEYINCINDDCCLEVHESNNLTDKLAKELLNQKYGMDSFFEISNMPMAERNRILNELKVWVCR